MFGARLLVNSRPGANARLACAPSSSRAMQRSSRMHIVADANANSAKKADAQTLRAQFSSAEEINVEVERLRAEMFTMRIKFAKQEEYKPAQYKALRKRVAQLLTIKREREIVAGITKRQSRKLEKQKLVEAGLGQF